MANTNTYCNDPDEAACLDALIKEINDELTIACQIPFTVPKKELANIIKRAKGYFYKIYEDSVEQMYIKNPRGIVQMPSRVFSVNDVFEIGGFSGEDGGFGSQGFNAGDIDFSVDKFIYSDTYGAGLGSENLMWYVINSLFMDNARQALVPQISYTFNRLTKKFRFQGELPKQAVIFEIFSTIPDCALFQDEAFVRYVIGQAKIQLARILGTFSFNLPGNITINYDMISSEGREEVDRVVEEIKADEGVDYFFTG